MKFNYPIITNTNTLLQDSQSEFVFDAKTQVKILLFAAKLLCPNNPYINDLIRANYYRTSPPYYRQSSLLMQNISVLISASNDELMRKNDYIWLSQRNVALSAYRELFYYRNLKNVIKPISLFHYIHNINPTVPINLIVKKIINQDIDTLQQIDINMILDMYNEEFNLDLSPLTIHPRILVTFLRLYARS